ncbi:unnamed protein product [Amoebophrya sp. A25]|nr:unnamed protein product [Amoebophrya sp. A25]|eukprot:GSA25T00025466001.1
MAEGIKQPAASGASGGVFASDSKGVGDVPTQSHTTSSPSSDVEAEGSREESSSKGASSPGASAQDDAAAQASTSGNAPAAASAATAANGAYSLPVSMEPYTILEEATQRIINNTQLCGIGIRECMERSRVRLQEHLLLRKRQCEDADTDSEDEDFVDYRKNLNQYLQEKWTKKHQQDLEKETKPIFEFIDSFLTLAQQLEFVASQINERSGELAENVTNWCSAEFGWTKHVQTLQYRGYECRHKQALAVANNNRVKQQMLLIGEEQKASWFSRRGKSLEKLAEDQHQHQQKIADLEEQMETLEATKSKLLPQIQEDLDAKKGAIQSSVRQLSLLGNFVVGYKTDPEELKLKAASASSEKTDCSNTVDKIDVVESESGSSTTQHRPPGGPSGSAALDNINKASSGNTATTDHGALVREQAVVQKEQPDVIKEDENLQRDGVPSSSSKQTLATPAHVVEAASSSSQVAPAIAAPPSQTQSVSSASGATTQLTYELPGTTATTSAVPAFTPQARMVEASPTPGGEMSSSATEEEEADTLPGGEATNSSSVNGAQGGKKKSKNAKNKRKGSGASGASSSSSARIQNAAKDPLS